MSLAVSSSSFQGSACRDRTTLITEVGAVIQAHPVSPPDQSGGDTAQSRKAIWARRRWPPGHRDSRAATWRTLGVLAAVLDLRRDGCCGRSRPRLHASTGAGDQAVEQR